MKTSKLVSILTAAITTASVAAVAYAADTLFVRNATIAVGEREVDRAYAQFGCTDVDAYDGWSFGHDCQGTVVAANGAPVFRGITRLVAVSPTDGLGSIAIPDADGETDGKVTCPGGQRECGPGSKFHGACDKAKGGYSGSNPDSHGIPQTWSCNVP